MTIATEKPMKPRKKNYVNNRDFFNALVAYQELLKTKPTAPIPDYIGQCIYSMSMRYSSKPNFSGYSFKSDMVGDALENCFKYLDKFNPEKGENAFAYFTMVIHNAFIRRIKEEQKQQYIKIKNMRRILSVEELTNGVDTSASRDTNEITSAFVRNFEEKNLTSAKKSSKVKPKSGLDLFEENDE